MRLNDMTKKTDIYFLPLGGHEQSWVKKEEAAVNKKKKICVKNSWDGYHVFWSEKEKSSNLQEKPRSRT